MVVGTVKTKGKALYLMWPDNYSQNKTHKSETGASSKDLRDGRNHDSYPIPI